MICDRCNSEIHDNSTSCEFCGNQFARRYPIWQRQFVSFKNDEDTIEFQSTTLGKRLINYAIDILAIMGLGFIIGIFFGRADFNSNFNFESTNEYLFGYLLIFLYYFSMEYMWGITLGKLATRTKVISLTNENINMLQIIWRTLCRFIPFEAFSILFSKSRRSWHDILSKTMVVDIEY